MTGNCPKVLKQQKRWLATTARSGNKGLMKFEAWGCTIILIARALPSAAP